MSGSEKDRASRGERIQKILARAGRASRRQAEELIRAGRVTVNGRLASLGQRVDPATDVVKLDGKRVVPRRGRRYVLLNKPIRTVTTRSDPEGRRTVFDLLPSSLAQGLVSVGRLDYNTEGLLLLTDDGDLAHRIAHPRYGCRKTYAVKVKGVPDAGALDRLRRGIEIEGRRTRPASVQPMQPSGPRRRTANSWWRVVLTEGRTRQIREMFFRIGHPVQRLRREAVGPLRDPRLPAGRWRVLREEEIERLRLSLGTTAEGRRRAGDPRPSDRGLPSAGRRRRR